MQQLKIQVQQLKNQNSSNHIIKVLPSNERLLVKVQIPGPNPTTAAKNQFTGAKLQQLKIKLQQLKNQLQQQLYYEGASFRRAAAIEGPTGPGALGPGPKSNYRS